MVAICNMIYTAKLANVDPRSKVIRRLSEHFPMACGVPESGGEQLHVRS